MKKRKKGLQDLYEPADTVTNNVFKPARVKAPCAEPEISIRLPQLQKIDAMSPKDRNIHRSIVSQEDGCLLCAGLSNVNHMKLNDYVLGAIEIFFSSIGWRKICLS